MFKTIARHGNSAALVIERPILELLKADADTVFEITTNGVSLILTPVGKGERAAALRTSMERVARRHKRTFEELAK